MSVTKKHSKEAPSVESLAAAVGALRKIVTLLVLVCLAISACLNVYLLAQNMWLKQMVEREEQLRTVQAQRAAEMLFLLGQLHLDLRTHSQDNEQIKEILLKFETPLSTFVRTGPQTLPPTPGVPALPARE